MFFVLNNKTMSIKNERAEHGKRVQSPFSYMIDTVFRAKSAAIVLPLSEEFKLGHRPV